jgi:hypothetical protein
LKHPDFQSDFALHILMAKISPQTAPGLAPHTKAAPALFTPCVPAVCPSVREKASTKCVNMNMASSSGLQWDDPWDSRFAQITIGAEEQA